MPRVTAAAPPVGSTVEVRAALERRLRAVHARLRPAEDPGPITGGDVADQVAHEEVRALTLGSRTLLVEDARRLVRALDRLHTGSYGVCLDCNEAIAPKRLQAIPEAERCLRCESDRERGHRHDGARPIRWDPAAWDPNV